jgi:hypothetical protein
LDFGKAQLELGGAANAFSTRDYSDELGICQRYYEKSFKESLAPAQNAGDTNGACYFMQNVGASTAGYSPSFQFKTRKRITPNITTYSINNSSAQIYNFGTGSHYTSTGVFQNGEASFNLSGTSPSGSSLGNMCAIHWDATAEL